ncbi:fimbrial biogenesis outer membrane usher protein [Sphingomonas sp. MG17]|uniref:Fimbrial biogenesis outer membrane usher protein n=2 Tax=Sphingomonas tagetis TaxID=2949092 RepID=A0A9X2HKI7_9SPHN|nr:fimbrial biogenesis outer membrane usher protein [Sphingomonas tagetis]
MQPSRPRADRAHLLGGCAFVMVALLALPATAAEQAGATTQVQERRVTIQAPPQVVAGQQMRLNPTGRPIALTVPVKDGTTYLGDIQLTIMPDDRIEVPAQRLIDLLANVVNPDTLKALQAASTSSASLSPADFASSGIDLRYNPQTLELNLVISAERRGTRSVSVSPLDRDRVGNFVQPAEYSAYLNIRGALDYLHAGGDVGFASPIFSLDGATRIGRIVAEGEAIWQPGAIGVDFQRLGSRLVFDDESNVMRWTAGDLQTTSRGFQSAPDIAGISIFRSYSVLQPQQIIRPRGDRSFRLDRPSTVDVEVNGQIVRRLQLAPGNYDLRDFPFTQGANDIRLSVLDDAGRTELLRFNLFLDQSQLAKGLSEFGLYAGVLNPIGPHGPRYSDDWAVTGFYRRGFTDQLTAGVNFQADERTKMGGAEFVIATPIGAFAGNFSISDIRNYGSGHAARLTFQRLIQRRDGQADSLTLFAETRSRRFGPVGVIDPDNQFSAEIGGGYSHAFNERVYAGFDGRYSIGRGAQPDVHSYRVTTGWRISDLASLTVDGRWERDSGGSRFGALASLVVRLGRYSSVRGDYDTRDNRMRASFQTLHGQGVGSYNITADVERSDRGSGFNFNGNYYANRAELGISHFGTFLDTFGTRTSQRTSMRVGTSLAIADGAFSVGRPIYDSFAIVKPHRTLAGADVVVEPTPFGFTANSGALKAGTHPSISSYAERTITVDAPNAPAGADLGQGSFRLLPPYRSGYKLEVGSDYFVTAIGRLLDVDGEPVSLVTGTATELSKPERTPVTVFTTRDGRFAAAGLAPGRWRIEMLDAKKSTFIITIPADTKGLVRLPEIQSGKDQ